MTDTTTPSGGGSACLGAACTGQVTAKFVWTPTANEVLPDEVYILQYASAIWNKTGLGPPPMGMMSPSVQELSYPSRQRARVHRIQTAPGGTNPTANNGLGDAQVVVTQGFSTTGTSKGFKVVKVSPTTSNSQTYVEVGPVTVGVTGMGNAAISPGWGYSAQIITPKMTHGTGGDITQPGTAGANVMVGEQNTVSVGLGISAVGNETPSISYQWTDPGDNVMAFQETIGPPNKGEKIFLSANELDDPSIAFFFYGGSSTGQTKDVQCKVTVDDTVITITGKIKVYRPTFTFVGEYNKSLNPLVQYFPASGWIRFTGLTLKATATNPPGVTTAGGKLAFQQITTSTRLYKSLINGTIKYQSQIVTNALDSTDPYPTFPRNRIDSLGNLVQDFPDSVTMGTELSTIDPAGVHPGLNDKGIDFTDSFETYLMYSPPTANSLWIPIAKLDWSWSVKAHQVTDANGNISWNVTDLNPKFVNGQRPADKTGVEVFSLPEWPSRAQDAPLNNYLPNVAW